MDNRSTGVWSVVHRLWLWDGLSITLVGMDFEVSPVALRQGAAALHALADQVRGDLVATYHVVAPGRSANPEWAATTGNDAAVVAVDATLAALAGRCRTVADALTAAALEYERTDENAARRWPR